MKIIVPSYYKEFKCISSKCSHSCCMGWDIEIDKKSLKRFKSHKNIYEHVEEYKQPFDDDAVAKFKLCSAYKCPFLREDLLCQMILDYGEDMICNTCKDHPRFRNFYSSRIEMGLGLVCEEAARIILSCENPLSLEEIVIKDGRDIKDLSEKEKIELVKYKPIDLDDYTGLLEEEICILNIRNELLNRIEVDGMQARLLEYLIYRHIPDTMYYDDLEDRIDFILKAYDIILDDFEETRGSFDDFVECARRFSYEVEYKNN